MEISKEQMVLDIKAGLRIGTEDYDLVIGDLIQEACDYCNLSLECIPAGLEPIVRKKAKGIIDYERVMGTGYHQEVSSIKEGDGSITWAQTEGNTRAGIYNLTETDKKALRRYRRLRGYAKPVCGDV